MQRRAKSGAAQLQACAAPAWPSRGRSCSRRAGPRAAGPSRPAAAAAARGPGGVSDRRTRQQRRRRQRETRCLGAPTAPSTAVGSRACGAIDAGTCCGPPVQSRTRSSFTRAHVLACPLPPPPEPARNITPRPWHTHAAPGGPCRACRTLTSSSARSSSTSAAESHMFTRTSTARPTLHRAGWGGVSCSSHGDQGCVRASANASTVLKRISTHHGRLQQAVAAWQLQCMCRGF